MDRHLAVLAAGAPTERLVVKAEGKIDEVTVNGQPAFPGR